MSNSRRGPDGRVESLLGKAVCCRGGGGGGSVCQPVSRYDFE